MPRLLNRFSRRPVFVYRDPRGAPAEACPKVSETAPKLEANRAFATAVVLAAAALVGPGVRAAAAQDVSAAATLQLFESSWRNAEQRSVDAFVAGYGGVWVPPPGRADSGGLSVGYDQYDRFDLGRPGRPTLYGTEAGLKAAIGSFHRFGASVYGDLVWNHNGFRDRSTPGFQQSGGYPGFYLGTGNSDGDFHSPFASGDLDGRLSGLIDINHSTNLQYVRNPVAAGDPRNIPNQTATEANRRFYTDLNGPGKTYFDPKTNQTFVRHDFTGGEATTGTPVAENVLGYLMRNAQWYVQDVGFDGFRLDATKHYEPYVLEYLDRAVYDTGRLNLDGSRKQVFSFGEALTGDMALIQSRVRKDINPATPGVVGGNRDALDFPLHFALNANLTKNGLQNDWRNVADASFDRNDDGLANNGSQGVSFDASHDDAGADLGNVAAAYLVDAAGQLGRLPQRQRVRPQPRLPQGRPRRRPGRPLRRHDHHARRHPQHPRPRRLPANARSTRKP